MFNLSISELFIMADKCAITKNRIMRFLLGVLPNRTKRLTFLASIAAIARHSKEPDEKTIHKLNAMLGLASTGDSALKLPIYVSDLIWTNHQEIDGDLYLLSKCTGSSPFIVESAERVVSSVPEWFLYDEKEAVMADLLDLFTKNEELFPSDLVHN